MFALRRCRKCATTIARGRINRRVDHCGVNAERDELAAATRCSGSGNGRWWRDNRATLAQRRHSSRNGTLLRHRKPWRGDDHIRMADINVSKLSRSGHIDIRRRSDYSPLRTLQTASIQLLKRGWRRDHSLLQGWSLMLHRSRDIGRWSDE